MEGKELSRAKIIEKKIRKLLEIDAEVELKGLGTRRVIEIIVKDVMEGKRGLAFDPKLGKLIFFPRPKEKENIFLTFIFAEALKIKKELDDKLAPVLKEIEENPELGPDVAKGVRKAFYEILFGVSR